MPSLWQRNKDKGRVGYDKGREIGKRAYSGVSGLYGLLGQKWRGAGSLIAACAEVISADRARNSGASSLYEVAFGNQVKDTESRIESWAKANGTDEAGEDFAERGLCKDADYP